jgi:hypothetical protein
MAVLDFLLEPGGTKNLLCSFLVFLILFLPEGMGFINELHVIFRNPFLQTSFSLGF